MKYTAAVQQAYKNTYKKLSYRLETGRQQQQCISL